MPFQKGKSGNPNGKPKGALNKSTILAQSLLDGEAEALVRKAVELALQGDPACLRICLERLVPPKKEAPLEIALPKIATMADLPGLLAAVTARLGEGKITLSGMSAILHLAEVFRKTLETAELEQRLREVEEMVGVESPSPRPSPTGRG